MILVRLFAAILLKTFEEDEENKEVEKIKKIKKQNTIMINK